MYRSCECIGDMQQNHQKSLQKGLRNTHVLLKWLQTATATVNTFQQPHLGSMFFPVPVTNKEDGRANIP